MATVNPRRGAFRIFAVVLLSLISLTLSEFPDVRRLWVPLGIFGYGTDLNGVVNDIEVGSPAARAGMQLGDRVVAPPQTSWFVIQIASVAQAGMHVDFDLMHRGAARHVSLTAVPEPMSAFHRFVIVLSSITAAVVIAIGATVVLAQPSVTTWGFFLFCLGNGTYNSGLALPSLLPFGARVIANIIAFLLASASTTGLLLFALRFLSDIHERWRRQALGIMPYFAVSFAALQLWQWIQSYYIGGPPANAVGNAVVLITWLAQFVALFAFLETYIRARGTDRQRILWVVVGFGVSLLAVSVQQFLTIYLTNAPLELDELISSLNICAPLSFAYAIIRYRVIDVNFVVSRALVYGVLTTLLVGIFSIIDWLFTDKLQLARLGTLAQVGAVVAFGVWFNGLHKRVDGFVDATFYRQRHRAEVQLARNAGALPFVTSGRAVAEVLVAEPVRAVGLASAALFRRCRDGSLHREQSIGWSDLEVTVLNEGDDHFIALLLATNGPLSLYDHPWRSQGVPPGPGCPVLALPIIVRRQLAAVVFYGSHPHGEALDPDEIKAIAGLAPGAAAAYDHLEAQTMSEQVSMLQAKVESLESRLAEAQIQPA